MGNEGPRNELADYMTFAQAAAAKGVHRTAIYDAVRAGRLSEVTVMGKRAIRRADLDAYAPRPYRGRGRKAATSA